jgi:hypothetical protein
MSTVLARTSGCPSRTSTAKVLKQSRNKYLGIQKVRLVITQDIARGKNIIPPSACICGDRNELESNGFTVL